ncbi:hypothetical protein IGJ83_001177 [Enterococcus pernyi]
MITRYRWRRILEIRYREGRKEHYYFNRKSYKKIYQLWVRAKRLGLTDLPHYDFAKTIVIPESRGVTFAEMEMNIGRLEKHLEILAEERRTANDTKV